MNSAMTPQEFVDKWANSELGERQIYQRHFLDLCKLVGHDDKGIIFEHSLKKDSGGQGFADVYYEGHFAVEYKAPGKYKDLNAAYQQLLQYRENLNNPPLLVVTDIDNWEIHTNFPNTEKRVYKFAHEEIASDSNALKALRAMFDAPERLHPRRHAEQVTEEAAEVFRLIADNMRQWEEKPKPQRIAHFLTKLVFCLFAEDVGLLPMAAETQEGIVTRTIQQTRRKPELFVKYMRDLFQAMADGGDFLMHDIRWFNGALFDDISVEELHTEALVELEKAAKLNWEAIEPSIFGTLFERSLDPRKRSQLGAHYTSRDDILLIVEPVLMRPLRYEWDAATQLKAKPLRERYEKAKTKRARANALNQLLKLREDMLERIRTVTVLDPACGSGNFLYVSLQLLMDLEKEVISHPLWTGLPRPLPLVHPRQMHGIEINPIAHALASIVVWIGYIQWRFNNGYVHTIGEPILEELRGNIVCKDAVLAFDDEGNPAAPQWPAVDVIVGNPPFLGNKKMWNELGNAYYERLIHFYKGQIPSGVDLVCYWFEQARRQLEQGRVKRVGLLATNSIRGGLNREILKRIKDTGDIFNAWSDREWILDGAAVRVSMVGFDNGDESSIQLDGIPVKAIFSNLTADVDITGAKVLSENRLVSFQGIIKRGPFDMDASLAASMIAADPKNKDVLKPIANGMDITRRPRGKWIVDFGVDTPIETAQKYKLPFEYVETNVKPARQKVRQAKSRKRWWLHESSRPIMRKHIENLQKYIVTPIVAKHRTFVWIPKNILPDKRLTVFARDDDYFFGVLHSKLHEAWSLRLGSWHGKGNDPRYTSTTTFETFPFPWPPGSEDTESGAYQAISQAAKQLHAERDAWLNPDGAAGNALKERTLTNLYNALQVFRGRDNMKIKPSAGDFAPRLDELHRTLDAAVGAAYGWDDEVLADDEEILRRLLALNLARA